MSDFEMSRIPAGSVTLHDARRKTQRTVALESFEIGSFAVTEEQMAEVLGIASRHPRRPAIDLSWLRAVRSGEVELSRVITAISAAESRLEELRTAPGISDQPDRRWVDDWLHRVHLDYWSGRVEAGKANGSRVSHRSLLEVIEFGVTP